MSKLLSTAIAVPASAELTKERLLDILGTMTEEEWRAIPALQALTAPTKKVGTAAAKKTAVPAARKAAAAAPLPEPDEDGVPTSAASYRLKEEDIDHAVCVGRILKGGKDRRWAPAIYREFQCGKAMDEDCDLCKICQTRLEKYAEEPKPGDWTGRVTEDPPGWVHMLDTEWAEAKKPKWLGSDAAAASDSGSEASSAVSKASKAAEKATEKEASKASKAAEKEAEKASKAAEKEAAKAVKEAEKATKAAAKEAEKAAKAAEKAAEKASKEPKESKGATKKAPAIKKATAPAIKKAATEVAPAKAASAAAATSVEMELKLIDGEIFAVKGQNVYKYDEDSEEAGVFMGRLTADETIDKEAKEADAEDEEE